MLHNSTIVSNHFSSTKYALVIYGFGSGHLFNSILLDNHNFEISYCADPNPAGRDLFTQMHAQRVDKNLQSLIRTIQHSDDYIDVIYITCPHLTSTDHQKQFIFECSQMIKIARKERQLKLVIIESPSYFDMRSINDLTQKYSSKYS